MAVLLRPLLAVMIQLLVLIPFLLGRPHASAINSQLLQLHGLSTCLSIISEGTALDRWLACVDSELGLTSSGPHGKLQPRRSKGRCTIELRMTQDELSGLCALEDSMIIEEAISTIASPAVSSTWEQQQSGVLFSSQTSRAYVESDAASSYGGHEESMDLEPHRESGNRTSSLFSNIVPYLCGLIALLCLLIFWCCKTPNGTHTSIAEAQKVPTNSDAATDMTSMCMSTESSSESLSAPLGRAIGIVFAEVLNQTDDDQHFFSADQVSKLLEVAMESQLSPVMGTTCNSFVGDVKVSCEIMFHTLQSVRHALPKKADVGCTKTAILCGSSSHFQETEGPLAPDEWQRSDTQSGTTVTEKAPEKIHCEESENLVRVCDVARRIPKAEDVRPDPEEQWLVIQKQHVTSGAGQTLSEAEDASSDNVGIYLCSGRGASHVEDKTYVSYPTTPPDDRAMEATSPVVPVLSSERPLQQAWLDVLERFIHVQEQRNIFEQILITQRMKRMSLIEEQLQASQESNQIMRHNAGLTLETNQIMKQTVDMTCSRAKLKEREMQEHRLQAGYLELKRTCADELAAGLCVMLLALGYGSWTYSYERLFGMVSSCQPVVKDRQRSLWMGVSWYQSALDFFTGHLLALSCEVIVAGRMLAGTLTIFVIGSVLLRSSVSTASHAMPVSVIVVVLGVICGVAGKLSVDSLGGSGYYWLLTWEFFCLLHAFANCFTSHLYQWLNGSSHSLPVLQRGQFLWLRRFFFHSSLVLSVPLFAGFIPFATFRELLYGTLATVTRAFIWFIYQYLNLGAFPGNDGTRGAP